MKMQSRLVLVLVGLVCVGAAESTMSQYYSGREETPAVSGYEQQLAGEIRNAIKDFSPKTDNLGNISSGKSRLTRSLNNLISCAAPEYDFCRTVHNDNRDSRIPSAAFAGFLHRASRRE
jgi:hypothetical protein